YLFGQPTTGPGNRNYQYSYDMATVNTPVTYGKVGDNTFSVPHGVGSIWATILWDMTWEIIFEDSQIISNIYDVSTVKGNVAALKLVNEGLRLQKCNPSFIDARNAILKADSLLFNSRYSCAIWKAFTRRGMGINASTGVSANDRIVVEDFTPMNNSGWVFTSPATSQTCSRNIFNYTATVSGGAGTPTFSWVRAAVAGISNPAKSGNTASISETLINTTNAAIEVTYKFYLSPGSCQIPFDVKVVVNPSPATTINYYEVCKDGTVPAGQGLVATSVPYTNTVNGVFTSASPTYTRATGNGSTVYIPGNAPFNNVFYKTHTFVPTTSGPVTIETIGGTLTGDFPADTYLSLYQDSFNPAAPATNFLIGDDDSGTLQYSSKFTYNLTAGTTYILVVTPYSNGMTGEYQVQATVNIFGGANSWYANSTGSSPLLTNNLFNPVGVAGSGIPNTATQVTKTFYAGINALGNCLVPATFTVG
ncbi:MAG: hypothetical protein EOP51_30330, partial [Sphingobacteriales bacterium]